jgi:hypothetical protein
MSPPKRVGPDADNAEAESISSSTDQSTDTKSIVATSCRCAYGEVCVCEFYENWVCDWNHPQNTVAQLTRRSNAALRTEPQHSGRRDPISHRLGRWAA